MNCACEEKDGGTGKLYLSPCGVHAQYARDEVDYALKSECAKPISMILHCPMCHTRHIDAGEFATKVHHTHACQNCGMVWRPAIVPTVRVQFLPGFKDEAAPKEK